MDDVCLRLLTNYLDFIQVLINYSQLLMIVLIVIYKFSTINLVEHFLYNIDLLLLFFHQLYSNFRVDNQFFHQSPQFLDK